MKINFNTSKVLILEMNKKGELQNAYSPLLNLVDSNLNLGDFTTEKLNFDVNTPVDMLIVDEYDGSTNVIINDDTNIPKLINNRFSKLENNTFKIPIHNSKKVTNIYKENTFDKDTQLLKLYSNIPTLTFDGIHEGGNFKCGSYVFYFKLSDADGNTTNIIQESGIVQVHIGIPNSKKIRMGLLDENAKKSIKFILNGIDSGFDYVRIFYERTSSDSTQAVVPTYFMIDQNYPIINGKCDILLQGEENIIEIDKSEIQTQFADIATAKTQAVVDNTLFLGNVSAFDQDYQALQLIAWRIIPSISTDDYIGGVDTLDYSLSDNSAYYNIKNTYNKTGYWAEEYYRFGIVFIYNTNLLSPVFNIQGCDLSKNISTQDFFLSNGNKWESEPENFLFNSEFLNNSKGVVKLPKKQQFEVNGNKSIPHVISIKFDLSNINKKNILTGLSDADTVQDMFSKYNIKGFFFVRQKRIPTILGQGIVIGLTGKDYGCLPVLLNNNKLWITKSFLNTGRILHQFGSTVKITSQVKNNALLLPDYEVNEATLNLIFTSEKFLLEKVGHVANEIIGDHHYTKNFIYEKDENVQNDIKLTAVPKNTKLLTNGENYFSTLAGNPHEAFKTSDVNHKWNETVPQELTASTSLVRGNWGSYVGMSDNNFSYGDIVNIRQNSFKNSELNKIEFEKRFKDYSLYSAITPRYNCSDLGVDHTVCAYRGDCFINPFTHRMMGNFIDPELPTNKLIINPGCWVENYAVRCTALILNNTHSNLTSDSDGWYIPLPNSKKSAIVSLIFGILTANVGTIVNAISDLASDLSNSSVQGKYANEIVLAFLTYTGKSLTGHSDSEGDKNMYDSDYKDDGNKRDPISDNKSSYTGLQGIQQLVSEGHIKKVNPKRQEQQGGLNLKALFIADDKWELHGLSSINRADVNAVSFGSWITFPICSQYNLAMRDIDFSNATEEASIGKKRSFYPYEEMDPTNCLLESNVINIGAKISLSNNKHTAYTTVPYIKLEYFNRIYWSKPNVTENFINSYRMIFSNQYKEYNKEFGAITKILPLDNALFVVFLHGIGILGVNRSPQNEQEQSLYLSSRNVLSTLLTTISKDYGSMWKDSVIKTPSGIIYGVDTVAKKIWRYTGKLEFISDHHFSKFLNENINLSEYDFNEYQGHINVKTHYNEFKKDVMFTYYKDIPMTYHKFDASGNIVQNLDEEGNPIWEKVDLSGNLILLDTVNPKQLIDKWESGKTWSLCYNEVYQNWITFYDWYPVESCNVDNIFFSFDKDLIDETLRNKYISKVLSISGSNVLKLVSNKVFLDKAFTNQVVTYKITGNTSISLSELENKDSWFTFYAKSENPIVMTKSGSSGTYNLTSVELGKTFTGETPWKFYIAQTSKLDSFTLSSTSDWYVSELKFTTKEEVSESDLNINDPILKYYKLRKESGPFMPLYKHGQAGLYDNQGKILPTYWYDKLHEFNVEFVVNQDPLILKIFNNLKIISNKTAPNKFEYEIVGEGYDWYDLKPVVLWINQHAENQQEFEALYEEVLTTLYDNLRLKYLDFPYMSLYEGKMFKKLPFLHLETCDKVGKQDKSYHRYKLDGVPDKWDVIVPTASKNYRYTFNTSETILVNDELLNENRVHTESLGQDVKKYGRLRGNMQYLEDLWDIEIRPIVFDWAYVLIQNRVVIPEVLSDGTTRAIRFKKSKESRHRDKYIKVKIRYSGEDLAVIQSIMTMFDYSFA